MNFYPFNEVFLPYNQDIITVKYDAFLKMAQIFIMPLFVKELLSIKCNSINNGMKEAALFFV